jgi:hypothetical protein
VYLRCYAGMVRSWDPGDDVSRHAPPSHQCVLLPRRGRGTGIRFNIRRPVLISIQLAVASARHTALSARNCIAFLLHIALYNSTYIIWRRCQL